MSQMRFLYTNLFDAATLTPSSEVTSLPAENTQDEILGKPWKTVTGFTIVTGMNDKIGFKATSTGAVVLSTVASGTYIGTALASAIQTAMRSSTVFDLTCGFNSADNKFRINKGSTATALSLQFPTYRSSTVATIIGFDKDTIYSGETGYTSTASLGNQAWMKATIEAGTSTYFVFDKHNLPLGTVLTLRLATATSTFSGLDGGVASASASVILTATCTVYALPSSFSGRGLLVHWWEPTLEYSQVGRIWIGNSFYPANHPDNEISWFQKIFKRYSKQTRAVSGATHFDVRDSVIQYEIHPDPLNEYYNAATKTGWETFLEDVGNDKCFYTILDSDLSHTVYGFFIGDTKYPRQKNTPTILIKKLLIQEQK